MRKHGVSPVVCVNHFTSDFDSEVEAVFEIAKKWACAVRVRTTGRSGGAGSVDLARAVVEAAEEPAHFKFPMS